MAYRFTSNDASITEGVRRIAAEEFAHLRASLADKSLPVERKVHEGRKATKRLRTLLRLTAPVFPGAADEIAALAEAARQLSALRDKGALHEALARLKLQPDLSEALSAVLAQAPARTPSPVRLLRAFGRAMNEAAERALDWTLEKDGWKALAPGLELSHRRFRKALKDAKRAKDEDPVHTFRKRAKDCWHQTLLLRGAFADVMDGYAAAGEHLGDDLGYWRDLGLLEQAVCEAPAHLLTPEDSGTALAVIAKARRRALRRAFRVAERLAAESPEAYSARLKAWWRTSR